MLLRQQVCYNLGKVMKLPVLRRVLVRERVGYLVAGPLLIAVAVALDLAEFAWFQRKINLKPPPGAVIWGLRLCALAVALTGVWLLRRGVRSVEAHPLWRLVAEHPGDVVRVHKVGTTEYQTAGVTLNRQTLVVVTARDPAHSAKVETFAAWADELVPELERHVAEARSAAQG